MKLTIVSAAYPYRGGIAGFANILHQKLSESHNVNTVTFTRQYPGILFPGKTQLEESGTVAELVTERSIDSINPLSWRRTGKAIKQYAPDYVIFKYWMPFFAPAYGKIARIAKSNGVTKVAALCHNVIPHEKRPGDLALTKYFFSQVDKFLLLSSTVEEELKSVVAAPDYKVLFHPVYSNFGDTVSREDAEKRLNIHPGKKNILFFGFIREYKGLDTLLKAAGALKGRLDFNLIIAGEFYSEKEKYTTLMKEHKLENRIILADKFIPSEDVKYYFSAADLVVLPYKSATQSGVTQAAFNFLKPVIATNVGGLKEVIHNGKNGYLVPPEDPDALAAAIEKYFAENKGREFSEYIAKELDSYSWNTFTTKLTNFLNRKV